MDVKWLYRMLSPSSERLTKGEFETTQEYELRVREPSSLPPPLTRAHEYPFRIEAFELTHRLRYDADTEQFGTGQFGKTCLDANKSPELEHAYVVCDVSDLESQEGGYVGSNAYGASREVRRLREHRFGLAILKEDPFSSQFLKGYQGFQDHFFVPRDRARLSESKRVGVLFVGRLMDARLIAGQSTIITPTVSNPSDFRVTRTAVRFTPTRVVYYVIETGDILFERAL